MSSEIETLLASEAYKSLHIKRSQLQVEIENICDQLEAMGDTVLPQRFLALEDHFESTLKKWRSKNSELLALFTKSNIDPVGVDVVTSDQKSFNVLSVKLMSVIDSRRSKLESAGKLIDGNNDASPILSAVATLTQHQQN